MKEGKMIFWFLYHAGIAVLSCIVAMLLKFKQTGDVFHPTIIVTVITIFVMSATIGYMAVFLVNNIKRYKQDKLNRMIVPALIAFYIATFLIANISVTLGVFAWFIYIGRDLSEFWTHLFKHELNFASGRLLIWLLFFTVAFFYILWQESVKKEQRLRLENLVFKHRTLKSQVNPHFLFNSLNTLSELVYIDARKSDKYIQKLSSIYRYILEYKDENTVDLDREIEFVNQYFSLQQERDGDKIQLEIDVKKNSGFKIIPISLQILVENALKHNAISSNDPLKIGVRLGDSCIVVTNPIKRKNILQESTKSGLSNLNSRIKLILDKEIVVKDDNISFTVELPILL